MSEGETVAVPVALLRSIRLDYSPENYVYGELGKFIPKPKPRLPLPIGSIIYWREENDAGKNITVFAERTGPEEWRQNGFDLLTESMIVLEIREHDWAELRDVSDLLTLLDGVIDGFGHTDDPYLESSLKAAIRAALGVTE